MCAMGFRALLTIGGISVCGLSHVYAGNGPSKPKEPMQEIAAILQYDKSGQLRKDIDNEKFVELLLKAYEANARLWAEEIGKRNWRPAVEAYHAAFQELKTRLQGEWRRIFGDGPSRFPWNGHSDEATDLWREDDLRRDIPVVLSLWDSGIRGHICRTKVCYKSDFEGELEFWVSNDNRAYVPNDSLAYSNQQLIDDGKKEYKAYVLKFFNTSSLSKCKKYLRKFFSVPVSKLLGLYVNSVLSQGAVCKNCKEDLKPLLNLYADYYSLDAIAVENNRGLGNNGEAYDVNEQFGTTTFNMVKLMTTCYLNYQQWDPESQKWLCSLLDNLDANYYVKENLHTYCIQSHHLLRGYEHINFTGIIGMSFSMKTLSFKGLAEAFEELGYNPLPKETWLKFVNYAGRRLSLVRETKSWSEQPKGSVPLPPTGPNEANTVLHRNKTFDLIPCDEPEGVVGKIAWEGESNGMKP